MKMQFTVRSVLLCRLWPPQVHETSGTEGVRSTEQFQRPALFAGIGIDAPLVRAGTVVAYHAGAVVSCRLPDRGDDVVQVADPVDQLRFQCLTGRIDAAVGQPAQFVP